MGISRGKELGWAHLRRQSPPKVGSRAIRPDSGAQPLAILGRTQGQVTAGLAQDCF